MNNIVKTIGLLTLLLTLISFTVTAQEKVEVDQRFINFSSTNNILSTDQNIIEEILVGRNTLDFTIKSSTLDADVNVRIRDEQLTLVYVEQFNNTGQDEIIHLDGLKPGLYQLVVETPDNYSTVTVYVP